jgi:hypothetical protein
MKKVIFVLALVMISPAMANDASKLDAIDSVEKIQQASWATGAVCWDCEVVKEQLDEPAAAPAVSAVDIYTPSEAFADVMSEPLVYVGRDYVDPILDGNGQVIPGGNLSCIYRNSKVYIVHDGCRPNHTMNLTALAMTIYSRNGGSVELYQEANVGSYNINQAGPNFNGSWRVSSKETPAISGQPNFSQMAAYVRQRKTDYSYSHYCSMSSQEPRCYGPRGPDVQTAWSEAVTDLWNRPLDGVWPQVHERILKAPRT